MKYKIFVDGQFGTTGLKIYEMLNGRYELEILKISEEDKKNVDVKQKLINYRIKRSPRSLLFYHREIATNSAALPNDNL